MIYNLIIYRINKLINVAFNLAITSWFPMTIKYNFAIYFNCSWAIHLRPSTKPKKHWWYTIFWSPCSDWRWFWILSFTSMCRGIFVSPCVAYWEAMSSFHGKTIEATWNFHGETFEAMLKFHEKKNIWSNVKFSSENIWSNVKFS